jgi:hypothetical protein
MSWFFRPWRWYRDSLLLEGTYYATIDQVWSIEEGAPYGDDALFDALRRTGPPTFIPRRAPRREEEEGEDGNGDGPPAAAAAAAAAAALPSPSEGTVSGAASALVDKKKKLFVYEWTKKCAVRQSFDVAVDADASSSSSYGGGSASSSSSHKSHHAKVGIGPVDIFGNALPSSTTQISHVVPASKGEGGALQGRGDLGHEG